MESNTAQVSRTSRPRSRIRFGEVHPQKALILMLLTGGLYAWYWMYRHWISISRSGHSTMPVILGIVLHPISVFSLFQFIDKASNQVGYHKPSTVWIDGIIWLLIHIVAFGILINTPFFFATVIGYHIVAFALLCLLILSSFLIYDIQQKVAYYLYFTTFERHNNNIEFYHLVLSLLVVTIFIRTFFIYPQNSDIPPHPEGLISQDSLLGSISEMVPFKIN